MPPRVHIGCCGWSYMKKRDFAELLSRPSRSILQAYAQLFETVEINSTFYRIPRVATASKWREESTEIRPDFHFTLKAFKGITHLHRFGTGSQPLFALVADVCTALSARIVLFQTPESFLPSPENVRKLKLFFGSIKPGGLSLVWEPRGKWEQEAIAGLCQELHLVHGVDPLRNAPLAYGKEGIAYFRIHGFGVPSMYRYDFSEKELEQLHSRIVALPDTVRDVYVFFNNVFCYENARRFAGRFGYLPP